MLRLDNPNLQPSDFSTYRKVRTLGRGTTGKVVLAKEPNSGHLVAMKRFERPSGWPWRPRKRAESEFAIGRDLDHPNLVRALALFFRTPSNTVGDPVPVLVLTLVPGVTLLDHLISYRLPQHQITSIARQMLSALSYLHDRLIVHRDISCDNIMVNAPNGRRGAIHAVLIDFGLARRLVHENERLTDMCGEGFMYAPEVLAGIGPSLVGRSASDSDDDLSSLEAETDPNGHWDGYLGPPIDVWGLGCVLWILQCRRVPFDAATFPELFRVIQRNEPQMTLRTKLTLSRDCKAALKGMLEKDPTRRWSVDKLSNCAWLR